MSAKKDDTYIANTLHPICERYGLTEGAPESNADVIYWGFVSDAQKMQLQGQAKALLFPSVREGWGIIVLEAGIMNTPSIVYDAPRLPRCRRQWQNWLPLPREYPTGTCTAYVSNP